MPNTGFGMTCDPSHRLRQELTPIQRTLPKCSTRFLAVTPSQTGKQANADYPCMSTR